MLIDRRRTAPRTHLGEGSIRQSMGHTRAGWLRQARPPPSRTLRQAQGTRGETQAPLAFVWNERELEVVGLFGLVRLADEAQTIDRDRFEAVVLALEAVELGKQARGIVAELYTPYGIAPSRLASR